VAGRGLLQQDGGNDADATLIEIQQIPLGEVPPDETRRVPEAYAGGLPAGEPREVGLRLVMIVPARAEDDGVESVESPLWCIPGNARDRDAAGFECPLDMAIAVRDVRPGEAGDEADAVGWRRGQDDRERREAVTPSPAVHGGR
jgi:hypothetical protein